MLGSSFRQRIYDFDKQWPGAFFHAKLLKDFNEWNLRIKGNLSKAVVLKLLQASEFPRRLKLGIAGSQLHSPRDRERERVCF